MLRRLAFFLAVLQLLLLAGCAPVGLRVPWGVSKLPWTVLYIDGQHRLRASGLDRPVLEKAAPESVAAAPTGAHLAAVDENGRLSIVPLLAGERVEIDAGVVETAFWPEVSPWSADGRALVFVARGDLRYYRLGRRSRQLTTTKDAFSPALSPDGKLVAFGRKTDNDQDLGLWVVPVAGGEPRQVIEATGDIFGACAPVWSPDGQWIAFLQAYEGGAVGVVKSDGTGAKVGIEAAWLPLQWSPDSTTITFPKIFYGESGDGLWRYTVGQEQAERVAGKGLTADAAFAPDNSRAVLALTAKAPEGKPAQTRLLEYSLPQWQKGTAQGSVPGQPIRLSFSPDGGQLALLTALNTDYALYLGDGRVGSLKKIASGPELAGWVRLPEGD